MTFSIAQPGRLRYQFEISKRQTGQGQTSLSMPPSIEISALMKKLFKGHSAPH